jgi:predicted flavoprotein YhiN
LTGVKPLERAISSAGGIAFEETDEHLMLRRLEGVFVAGEMLDWEAPTGGYLLQATFATGVAAAKGALKHLGIRDAALTRTPTSATRQP